MVQGQVRQTLEPDSARQDFLMVNSQNCRFYPFKIFYKLFRKIWRLVKTKSSPYNKTKSYVVTFISILFYNASLGGDK
jgi:hypothetical protein